MADLAPLDRAVRAARRGHDEAARRLLDAVLADAPDNERALAWRARVEGDPAVKAGLLRRVLDLHPGARWATDALAALGDTDAAAAPAPSSLDAVGRRAATLHHLQCPNCGGQVEVHPERGTKAAACGHCGSVLDLTAAQLEILGRVKPTFQPAKDIWPGAEATFDGERHVVSGWLRYKGWDSEESWTWDEWQLLGDSGAVRYLSWSREEGFLLQTPVRPTPKTTKRGIELPDGRLRFYETSPAKIVGMAGELTWRPRLGETLRVGEAKKEGLQYSAELTASEVEVVAGPRKDEIEVWEAFGREDILAELRARAERARRRRRAAAGISRLFLLGALAFVAVGLAVVPRLGSTVSETSDSYASGPVSVDDEVRALLPPLDAGPPDYARSAQVRQLAEDLVRYDTVEAGTVRLAADRAYRVEVATTAPVDAPRGVDVSVGFVREGAARTVVPIVGDLAGPEGTRVSETSPPFTIQGGAGDVRMVYLVAREWAGPDDGTEVWTEPVSFTISATVRRVWVPGPFYVAAAFALFLSLAFFVFSRTGSR